MHINFRNKLLTGLLIFLLTFNFFGARLFNLMQVQNVKAEEATVAAQTQTPSPAPTPAPSSTIEPSPSSTATPSPTPTPQPSSTIELSQSPSASPTASPTAAPTPVVTSTPSAAPTPTLSPTPTATPEPPVHGSLQAEVIPNASATSIQNLNLDPIEVTSSASLVTDKADYASTDSVVISGTGLKANTTYTLYISSTDPPAVNFHTDVKTDEKGEFVYAYQLDGIYRPNYKVELKDSTGAIVATTSFTDPPPPVTVNIGEFSQCTNDDGDGYATGNTGCRWTNGDINNSNSIYHEGDATPQRVFITQATNGSHTVKIEYQTTKGGKHAYDFETDDNFSELAPNTITNADFCEGISGFTGCSGLTPNLSPLIPTDSNAGGFDVAQVNRHFRIRNGTITTVGAPTLVSGTYASDSLTDILITYSVNTADCSDMAVVQGTDTCPVLITWGGHISRQADWGTGNSAVSISGSPYHQKVVGVDGKDVSSRDNQMAANAVVNPDSPTVATAIHNDGNHTTDVQSTTIALGSTIHDKATVDNTSGVNGTPTGTATFQFFSNGTCANTPTATSSALALLSGVVDATGFAQGPLGPGSYSFKAHYTSSDTTKWTDSDGPCEHVTVGQGTSTVATTLHKADHTVLVEAGSVPLGSVIHDLATVTPSGSIAPTGNVDFRFYGTVGDCTDDSGFTGGTTKGSIALDGANPGVAHPSTDTGALTPGTYAFKAKWAGDSNYTGNTSGCETFTVTQSQLVMESKVHDSSHVDKTNNSVPLGSVMHDTAKISGGVVGGFTPPAITFKFYTNNTCSDGTTVSNTGADEGDATRDRSAASAALGAGSYSYKAFVAGDANYLGTDSGCEPFTVNQGTLTLTTTVHTDDPDLALVGNAPLGAHLHDSASVGGINDSFAPANNVTFKFYNNNNCSGDGTGAGSHAISGGVAHPSDSKGPLAAGPHAFRAFYDGSTDANYGPDSLQSDCEPFTVDKAQLTVTTNVHDASHSDVTNSSVPLGSVLHDTATVTGGVDGFALPAVSFTLTSNFVETCSAGAAVANNGTEGGAVKSADSSALGAGAYAYGASVAGNDNYLGDDSNCEPFTVNKADPDVDTFIHNDNDHTTAVTSVPLGSTVHDKAVVYGIGTGGGIETPTGNVDFTFYPNGSCTVDTGSGAGNVTVDGSGVAHPSNNEGPLAAGSYSFKAHYNGDSNYNPADSDCESLTVNKGNSSLATELHEDSTHAVIALAGESTTGNVHDQGTVSVSPAFAAPTGNVDFRFYTSLSACQDDSGFTGGTTKGSIALDGANPGVAHPSDATGALAAGHYAFKAKWTGDDNYTGSTSGCEDFTVTTITINKLANGNGTFGYVITGPTNATPGIVISNGSTGSVTTIVHSGSYTVGENDPTPFVFVSLNCANAGVSSPVNRTSPSFNAPAGQNTICNFENTKQAATRTQGFWATHTAFSNTEWGSVPSTEKDISLWGGGAGCTGIIDADATSGANELMGGFWANIANKSPNGKRLDVDKARMQLLQQLLAALLNKYGLGTADGGIIATAENVYCTGTATQITAQVGILGNYNQSGDTIPLGTSVPNATPKDSKNQANILFWNAPKNPTPNL